MTGVVSPDLALVRDTYTIESFMTIVAALFASTRPGDAQSFLVTLPQFTLRELLTGIFGIIAIGVGTTAVATWAQAMGQDRVGPGRAAVVFSLQPVCAMLIAFFAGVEVPTTREILGGTLITAAAIAASFGGEREFVESDSDLPV